ncbi:unnamed protein product, partial [Durusdinium trenchii]
ALCSGRKRWRLVNRDEMSLLRPLYLADLNPVFPMDLEDGQARGVKVYETILEADDLIFVPAGWPHQVDNLETSMAISSNFIVCVLNKLSVDDNSHSARLKMWALFKRSANRQLSLAWLLSPHSNLF